MLALPVAEPRKHYPVRWTGFFYNFTRRDLVKLVFQWMKLFVGFFSKLL